MELRADGAEPCGHFPEFLLESHWPAHQHRPPARHGNRGEAAADQNDAPIEIAPAFIDILRPVTNRAYASPPRLFFKHNLGARAPIAIDFSADGRKNVACGGDGGNNRIHDFLLRQVADWNDSARQAPRPGRRWK